MQMKESMWQIIATANPELPAMSQTEIVMILFGAIIGMLVITSLLFRGWNWYRLNKHDFVSATESIIVDAQWNLQPCIARRCIVDATFADGQMRLAAVEIHDVIDGHFFLLDDRGQGTQMVMNGGTEYHAHSFLKIDRVHGYLKPIPFIPNTDRPNRKQRRPIEKQNEQRMKRVK